MSPFIDDRGRLFGRVSVVDIIVVLLIVAVGAFAWGRFSSDEAKMKGLPDGGLRREDARSRRSTESNVGEKVRDDGGAGLGAIEDVATGRVRGCDAVDDKGDGEPGGKVQGLHRDHITIKGHGWVSCRDGWWTVGRQSPC